MMNGMQRRDVLRAGAVAIGAAVLPRSAEGAIRPGAAMPATVVAHLRADWYLPMLGRIAELARPRFESGEFRGYTDEDSDREVDGYGKPKAERWEAPRWRFEQWVEEVLPVETFADAYLILACSGSESLIDGGAQIEYARGIAAECVSYDIFRIGLDAGWYKPAAEECPSAERLRSAVAAIDQSARREEMES